MIVELAERAECSVWRTQAQQDLINAYKHLRRKNEDEGARLFAVLPPDRTRGNGHKLKHMKFHKKITGRVVK